MSYRCHGKTIYFLGLFNSWREESSCLFSEGILEIIVGKGTGDSSFYYVNFHLIFLQGALHLLFSVQNISGAIFLENKSQSLSWSEDREIIAWLQCMVMGPSPSFLLGLQDLTTNTTCFQYCSSSTSKMPCALQFWAFHGCGGASLHHLLAFSFLIS